MLDKIQFTNIIGKNDFTVGDNEYNLLNRFINLLLEWNSKINLISRKEGENVWSKHLLGSLSILFKSRFAEGSKIVDIGTGGGFPGIPLAICLPNNSFTLVDSIQKKISVVTDIIQQLELPNAIAICCRAEELCRKPEHLKKYDYVTARAVAPISDIIGWTRPFLKSGLSAGHKEKNAAIKRTIEPGSIVIFKGGDVTTEIEQTRIKHNPKSIEVVPLNIEGIDPADFSDKKIVIIKP